MRQSHAAPDRSQHILRVVGAHVAGAGIERGHPHLFIGNAVGADDRQLGKVAVQIFKVRKTPVLNVEHDGLGMILRKPFAEFLARLRYLYGEMWAQSTSDGLGQLGVGFIHYYYASTHTSPIASRVNAVENGVNA